MLTSPLTAGDYRRKVKTIDELCAVLGPRPRKQRVVMCHGVFDLVHPGHIRHLLYAKDKADILVASLTADAHITKAHYRPFVPEDLRALNLAALEMVDYVIVDPNPTPIEHIGRIQPDYFAKGYEYGGSDKIHPKTQQEIDALRAYGGDILFTPGDIVYSSSHLIESGPPDIAIEKLLALMEAEGVTFDRLRKNLEKFAGQTVHVVGDTIVDSLTYTTMIGGMTKTPTPSVRFDNRVDFIGGAAIVAKHLRAAGAKVTFSTILGDDPLKDFVLNGLAEDGIDVLPIIDPSRPTTHKNAFVCGDYRLLKVDAIDNRSITDSQADTIIANLRKIEAKAVVFSDFRHGIFNRRTIPALTAAIPQGAFRVADSQVASRWGNILEFKGFDLVTPNEREARFSLADQDTGVRPLAAKLHEEAHCKTVILKLGDRGILTCREGKEMDPRTFFVVDSFVDRLVDAVGAGDALLAYATLSMLVDESEVSASILGSISAALECEADGNLPIGPAQVLKKIDTVEKRARFE
ncbi:MAG: adenylyltransferase/cytidyltransferase family protein [Proteobacteria bacterium]|nr:adenylyltransferase/cytidyltransferase family protein [Pseudomonadota bacterium]